MRCCWLYTPSLKCSEIHSHISCSAGFVLTEIVKAEVVQLQVDQDAPDGKKMGRIKKAQRTRKLKDVAESVVSQRCIQ